MSNTIYEENGFKDRAAYLKSLVDNCYYPADMVYALADTLGPSEDFDALVTTLEDQSEY